MMGYSLGYPIPMPSRFFAALRIMPLDTLVNRFSQEFGEFFLLRARRCWPQKKGLQISSRQV